MVSGVGVSHMSYMVTARLDAAEREWPDNPKAYGRYTASTLRQYWYRQAVAQRIRSTKLVSAEPWAADEVLSKYPDYTRPL